MKYTNTGDCNTGRHNTGHRNTGRHNTGHRNTGNRNTGNWNTGNRNTGNWNTGDCNTGRHNTGHRNTGNWHVGCFNTKDAEEAYYFNRPAKVSEWSKAEKPEWIFKPSPTTWVHVDDMTNAEKIAHPNYTSMGGYLRTNDMKAEWRKSYEGASKADRELVKKLPNFDAEVFLEITGLDLREPEQIIEVGGRKYKLMED